jgi:hypothetical protein
MERNNLKHISMGEPTYWPSDRNQLLDLVDFCVTKGIPQDFAVAKSCFDFRRFIIDRLTLIDSLKSVEDTEVAVKFFSDTMQ